MPDLCAERTPHQQHSPGIDKLIKPTIGMDFSTKVCYGSKDEYKLQLWDTAGQ